MITNFKATNSIDSTQILLTWNRDWSGSDTIRILRSQSDYPTSHTDGELIYEGVTVDSYSDTNVSQGETWFYAIFRWNGSAWEGGDSESRTFATAYGKTWIQNKLYSQFLPEVYQHGDKQTNQLLLPEVILSNGEKVCRAFPTGKAGDLQRFLYLCGLFLDQARGLVELPNTVFNPATAPPWMLTELAKYLDVVIPCDLRTIYLREIVQSGIPLNRRKGTLSPISYLFRILTGAEVFVEEYLDHCFYFNVPGSEPDRDGNQNVTNEQGSFFLGISSGVSVDGLCNTGSFLMDLTSTRVYAPDVVGVWMFLDELTTSPAIRDSVGVTSALLQVLKTVCVKYMPVTKKWFYGFSFPSAVETVDYSIVDSGIAVDDSMVIFEFNNPDTGFNLPGLIWGET